MLIHVVTIVGANGNMGKNVSGIIASFGSAKVFLVSRKLEDSKKAIDRICQSIRTDDIRNRLIPKTYDDLAECVDQSDWVFESVAEDLAIKIDITKRIFDTINDKTIVTTGTSGLSLSKIAESLSEDKRARYFGTHFFNPPYNLSLCEVITTDYVDEGILASFQSYLKETLMRTVVLSKDQPAFLANRVGFQFINNVMLLAGKLKSEGGIDYVDYLFQGVTGRGMPPLVTANFVGLDIHKAIIQNLLLNTTDYENHSFHSTDFLDQLISLNYLGTKTEKGLYGRELIGDKIVKTVYDLEHKSYRPIRSYHSPLIESMKLLINVAQYEEAFKLLKESTSAEAAILNKVLAEHIIYSVFVATEVSTGIDAIDKALVTGFNWIAPTDLVYLMGGVGRIKEIYLSGEQSNELSLRKNELDNLFSTMEVNCKSKYDYRRFIKA